VTKKTVKPVEQMLSKSFDAAHRDLLNFATSNNIDLTMSGATCAVAVWMYSDVYAAWMGDARILAASTVGTRCQVDMLTSAHTTEDARELERVR